MSDRIERIRETLTKALSPTELDIIDESHLHAGHAGARSGKGHFRVHITSAAFNGQSMLEQHRLVYEVLDEMMKTDIHALSVKSRPQSA